VVSIPLAVLIQENKILSEMVTKQAAYTLYPAWEDNADSSMVRSLINGANQLSQWVSLHQSHDRDEVEIVNRKLKAWVAQLLSSESRPINAYASAGSHPHTNVGWSFYYDASRVKNQLARMWIVPDEESQGDVIGGDIDDV